MLAVIACRSTYTRYLPISGQCTHPPTPDHHPQARNMNAPAPPLRPRRAHGGWETGASTAGASPGGERDAETDGGAPKASKTGLDARIPAISTPRHEPAHVVARAHERRSPKSQALLRKEGPPTYAILSQNLVLSRFTRFLKGFHRAFNESHPAFVEFSKKAILLS